jgi:hydrogenase nickel incorporation protein HypA/HybF
MHELSIAESILDSVRSHAAVQGGRRVCRVGVRIGDTSGVNADALEFCFGLAAKDTQLEGATLEIERVPVRFRCGACAEEFLPVDFGPRCPSCGAEAGRLVGGDELGLSFLEFEEPDRGVQ